MTDEGSGSERGNAFSETETYDRELVEAGTGKSTKVERMLENTRLGNPGHK